MNPTRRELLIRLGAAILTSPWAAAHPARAAEPDRAVAELVASWRKRVSGESAIALGRVYLDQAPDEASADALARLLWATPELEGGSGGNADELAARLRRAIEADFARRDTVQIQGWVLSVTECRLCALVALAGHPS